jgi:hypothetical protein
MGFHTKHHAAFESLIRKDEDDQWIWQGNVDAGKPIITINGVEWDARLFALAREGHAVDHDAEVVNKYNSNLDCNPKHNTLKTEKTNKYVGTDNADMEQTHHSRNSADT